jgi:hypothetical protein
MLLNLSTGARDINKFFNIVNPICVTQRLLWRSDLRGGIQTRCAQTSDVITKLVNGLTFDDNPLNPNLTSPMPFNNIINNAIINAANVNILNGHVTSTEEILNFQISFPAGTEPIMKNFPGHVANILFQVNPDGSLYTLLVQSFIYKYNMKIIYLGDNADRYFKTIYDLFLNGSPVFSYSDEVLYRYLFGAEMTSYDGTSLVGRSKPNYVRLSVSKAPKNNFIQTIRGANLIAIRFVQAIASDIVTEYTINIVYDLLNYREAGPAAITLDTKKNVLIDFFQRVALTFKSSEDAYFGENCDTRNFRILTGALLTQQTANIGEPLETDFKSIMLMKSPKRKLKNSVKKNFKKSPKRKLKSVKKNKK